MMTAPTEPTPQSWPANRKRQAVIIAIGVTAIGRLPRDPGFQRLMIVAAVVLAAVIDMARNGKNASFERLVAWDARQKARAAHTAATAKKKPR